MGRQWLRLWRLGWVAERWLGSQHKTPHQSPCAGCAGIGLGLGHVVSQWHTPSLETVSYIFAREPCTTADSSGTRWRRWEGMACSLVCGGRMPFWWQRLGVLALCNCPFPDTECTRQPMHDTYDKGLIRKQWQVIYGHDDCMHQNWYLITSSWETVVSWRNPISVSAVSNTLTPGLEEREARRVRTFHGTVGVDKSRVCSRGKSQPRIFQGYCIWSSKEI